MSGTETPLLRLERFSVRFAPAPAVVTDFSLEIGAGECLGIVGESGAGKSLALLAAMGLAPAGAQLSGTAEYRGTSLREARCLARIRGCKVAMVFQDSMSSLTPHLRIGTQLVESLKAHERATWRTARATAQSLLAQVGISEPSRRLGQYPHELSGGMRQRVMIAMALASGPELIIADEPTTALDVTTQAGILALLLRLKRERGLAIALISHDFGVIAGIADRVAVVRGGRIVETGRIASVLRTPRDDYTKRLILDSRSLDPGGTISHDSPGSDASTDRFAQPALEVCSLSVSYRAPRRLFGAACAAPALEDVSLDVAAGESFGVLGESGSGKSTLIRAILRLLSARQGRILWMGAELSRLDRQALRAFRHDAQLIFQDPFGSLDPSMSAYELVAEPLRIHRSLPRSEERELVLRALSEAQLDPQLAMRFPEQLSGGQCQRVGIARALVLEPDLLVCDEPVSALDVSVQAQIVALFQAIRRKRRLTLVLVSHHLGIVRALCARALVLYRGRMMECAPVAQLYQSPAHPYTRALLAAIPVADPDAQPSRLLAFPLSDAAAPESGAQGCRYRMRCPHAIGVCQSHTPEWELIGAQHRVACHRWREILAAS